MSERLNKTSICSVVFLDIVGYSQKAVSEQIEYKNRFNALISEALKDVALNDRIILDTGDGAAITLLGEPQTALFTALTIRDGILGDNRAHPDFPLHVRIGINLGPVQVVKDINDHLNIIGDGINVAQRVMSFAEPNQILVSRSYYEIVSRLTSDMLKMFSYSGIKHDKHVREHEVYAILPSGEDAASAKTSSTHGEPVQPSRPDNVSRTVKLAGVGLVVVAVIAGVLVFRGKPQSPVSNPQPVVNSPPAPPPAPVKAPEPVQTRTDTAPAPKKSNANTPKKKPKPASAESAASHETAATGETEPDHKKSGWDKFKESVKQGTDKPICTEAQRSMNLCK